MALHISIKAWKILKGNNPEPGMVPPSRSLRLPELRMARDPAWPYIFAFHSHLFPFCCPGQRYVGKHSPILVYNPSNIGMTCSKGFLAVLFPSSAVFRPVASTASSMHFLSQRSLWCLG